jgi:uncharacterized protein (UPF0297 family)
MGAVIEVRRTVFLEIRGSEKRESEIEQIVGGVIGGEYADLNHYGYCSELRVEYFDDDYPGKNPAEEVETELIKVLKEKGYVVIV